MILCILLNQTRGGEWRYGGGGGCGTGPENVVVVDSSDDDYSVGRGLGSSPRRACVGATMSKRGEVVVDVDVDHGDDGDGDGEGDGDRDENVDGSEMDLGPTLEDIVDDAPAYRPTNRPSGGEEQSAASHGDGDAPNDTKSAAVAAGEADSSDDELTLQTPSKPSRPDHRSARPPSLPPSHPGRSAERFRDRRGHRSGHRWC